MNNITQWHGCYSGSWNGILVPDAFAHPAKVAPGLAYRIYRHMLDAGYIRPGDSVVDPFGGIGGFAYHALLLGLHFTGIELEPRFVELGQRNLEKWGRDLAMLNGTLGTARLLQGDSRRLLEVVGAGMGAAVSSPPYGESLSSPKDGEDIGEKIAAAKDSGQTLQRARWGRNQGSAGWSADTYGDTPGQLGAMPTGDYAAAVTSPPFGEQQSGGGIGAALQGKGDYAITTSRPSTNVGYANQVDSPGNLAALRADDAGFTAAVSSPPFVDQLPSHDDFQPPHDSTARLGVNYETAYGNAPGQLGTMKPGDYSAAVSSPPYADNAATWVEGPGARHDTVHHNGDNAYKASSDNGYGGNSCSPTPGNVGHMRDAGFEAAVSSPPYEHSLESRGDGIDWEKTTAVHRGHRSAGRGAIADGYGHEPGNIGGDVGDTFWAAARAIVEQTYAALRPGGYAAWVTKDFVRKGQRVPFSDQWQQLCAAVGFEPVERIAAMLVDDHGDQLNIFGGATARRKERKSFFRRLAEKKGSPRIDHEDVIIMRKPAATE